METIIIGHRNPDTDSVVSAIAYSNLKNKIDPKNKYIPAIAGKLDKDTKFALNYFNQVTPKIINKLSNWKGQIIILDHTELSQTPLGMDESKIKEIIDHHRLGGMQTPDQVYARIEPIGSTSTIIAKMFRESRIIPSKGIAGLLISGIISDTLFLKGPTTTDDDRNMMKELNAVCQIADLNDYAEKIFEAKSDINDISYKEIVLRDYKEFNFNQKIIGIGLCETLKPQSILKIRDVLIIELRKLKERNKLDFIFFIIVDVLNQESQMILIGKKEQKIAEKVFGVKAKDGLLSLGNRISRKKEIVPPLEKFFKK